MAVVLFPMAGLTQWQATTHLGEGLVLRIADFPLGCWEERLIMKGKL